MLIEYDAVFEPKFNYHFLFFYFILFCWCSVFFILLPFELFVHEEKKQEFVFSVPFFFCLCMYFCIAIWLFEPLSTATQHWLWRYVCLAFLCWKLTATSSTEQSKLDKTDGNQADPKICLEFIGASDFLDFHSIHSLFFYLNLLW